MEDERTERQQEAPSEEARQPVPTARPPRTGRKWTLIVVAVIFGLPILGMIAWTAITLNYTYSAGDRAGYVQKLSKKGWLCKTWEGDSAQVNIPGATQEHFFFTVRDDSIAAEISKLLGSQVSLAYKEHKGVPGTCFGESDYYVEGVRQVGPASIPAPVGPPALPAPGVPKTP